MDVVFDIDGTLADATHRLHLIKQEPKDWNTFLSQEEVDKDAPIIPMFETLEALYKAGHRIIFITGRKLETHKFTYDWIKIHARIHAPQWNLKDRPVIYMREIGDYSLSEVSKRKSLHLARSHGYDPKMVFEDRRSDAEMWRDEGLLCCHVAEGNY